MLHTLHLECRGQTASDDDAVPHGRLDLGEERRDLQERNVSKFNKAVEGSHYWSRLMVQKGKLCVYQRMDHQHDVYQRDPSQCVQMM
jgi:hypothetical protein